MAVEVKITKYKNNEDVNIEVKFKSNEIGRKEKYQMTIQTMLLKLYIYIYIYILSPMSTPLIIFYEKIIFSRTLYLQNRYYYFYH